MPPQSKGQRESVNDGFKPVKRLIAGLEDGPPPLSKLAYNPLKTRSFLNPRAPSHSR
jgi:hypothetical protein